MTLNNKERAARCRKAIAAYSDDDAYTNLVDFLTDAMHLCHQHERSFHDALETASVHFEAERYGNDIVQNFATETTTERNRP